MVRPDWTEETAVILYTEETIPYTVKNFTNIAEESSMMCTYWSQNGRGQAAKYGQNN